MNIGERLIKIRKSKNETQEDFAKIIGIGKASLQRYESGERSPTLEMLQKISSKLDMELSELIGYGGLAAMEQNEKDKELGKDYPPLWGPSESELKEKLNEGFENLNLEGKIKAVDCVELVAKVPEYVKDEE
ncbi:helix-turn-helix transcriptional regulator [Eubacteriaceae bacterium ES2]|nr:helix-turn-helix transcriptional regulator [Eubacteriaceae bacterium ES2]